MRAWGSRHRIVRALISAVSALALLNACGGSKPPVPAENPPERTLLGPITTKAGTVQLPSGSKVNLASLRVVNSLGEAVVSTSGTFTLRAFQSGAQLAIVLSPSGTPMLMGWFGEKSPAINARSTAEVLVYFATASFALPAGLRQPALELIPGVPGLSSLETAISTEIATNADAFATDNGPVSTALKSLVTSMKQESATATKPRVHSEGMVVDPLSRELSGARVIVDFPNSIHFQNRYLRLSRAVIEREFYITNDNQRVDSVLWFPEPIEVPPVQPLNGFTGTLIDIFNGRFAMSEVSTEPVALPVVEGSKSTHYRVTLLGPGIWPGDFLSIRPVETIVLEEASRDFVIKYIFLPYLLSFMIPNVSFGEELQILNSPEGKAVLKDFINTLGKVPNIAALSRSGDIGGALLAARTALLQTSTLQLLVRELLVKYLFENKGLETAGPANAYAEKLLEALKVTELILLAINLSVIKEAMLHSEIADIWTIDVTPNKVTLTPSSAIVTHGARASFTATVEGQSSDTTLEYRWQNTANFGHTDDASNLPDHRDNFTSTHKTVSYLGNASGTGTDTIAVEVFLIEGRSRTSLDKASATVTLSALPPSDGGVPDPNDDCSTIVTYSGTPDGTGKFQAAAAIEFRNTGPDEPGLPISYGDPRTGTAENAFPVNVYRGNPVIGVALPVGCTGCLPARVCLFLGPLYVVWRTAPGAAHPDSHGYKLTDGYSACIEYAGGNKIYPFTATVAVPSCH